MVLTKDLWKMPDAISDWLGTGYDQMIVLKEIEGTTPYGETQKRFVEVATQKNLQIPTSEASIRKLIKGYEKIGFIEKDPTLIITTFGNNFVNAHTNLQKEIALRESLLRITFWNPFEKNMNRGFDVNPYQATLYALLNLNYLTRLEIGNEIIFIKNDRDLNQAIEDIKNKRSSNSEYPMWQSADGRINSNIANPVIHLMSLYACTDYITKNNRKDLVLNPSKVDEIKALFSSDVQPEQEMITPPSQRASYPASPIDIVAPEEATTPSAGAVHGTAYTRNPLQLERANQIHQKLINMMIEFLKSNNVRDCNIRASTRIDLFAIKGSTLLLMEMKSMTLRNNVSQIRRGISQLLEYEFFDLLKEGENLNIIKFLILESKPINHEYIDFIKYCNIHLLWLDGEEFKGDDDSIEKLNNFFA